MLLDSSVEVVNGFPKPKKIVSERDLHCEKAAYEETFEGKLETSLGDLEGPSEMPIPIQTKCSENKINRKYKYVPLRERTRTLADLTLTDETSTIPKESFRIPNKNQE
jgi:hypothetical protein